MSKSNQNKRKEHENKGVAESPPNSLNPKGTDLSGDGKKKKKKNPDVDPGLAHPAEPAAPPPNPLPLSRILKKLMAFTY